MNAADLYALIQAGRFINETVRMYQNGDISDEELEKRWEVVKNGVKSADDLWKQAREKQGR